MTVLLTPKQAAERLGLSPNTLEKWRCVGDLRLRYVRLTKDSSNKKQGGGVIKYREEDIEDFISKSVVGGDTEESRPAASSLRGVGFGRGAARKRLRS